MSVNKWEAPNTWIGELEITITINESFSGFSETITIKVGSVWTEVQPVITVWTDIS